MNPLNKKQLKWERERERFRIADRFPPKPVRKEKNIGEILASVLKESPVEKVLPNLLKERWPLVVGEQMAKHTEPAYLREKTLYVNADHPGWLTELRRLPKNHILKKISAIPEAPVVRDIRFQLDPSIRTRRN